MSRFDLHTMQLAAEVSFPPVYGDHTVGQSVRIGRDNLSGFQFPGSKITNVNGPIVVHLKENLGDVDLLKVIVDPAEQQAGTELRVRFPELETSAGNHYFLLIEAPLATRNRALHLRGVERDLYAPGTAYVDGIAASGDLAFQTMYRYRGDFLKRDILTALRRSWLILPLIALLWAPGAVILSVWPDHHRHLDTLSRLSVILGISLAFAPFILLWITQLGSRLTAASTRWLYGLVGLGAVILTACRWWQNKIVYVQRLRHPTVKEIRAALLGGVLLLGLTARLLAIRDLAIPAWVDSVHHTTLVRMIVERGQVPTTYVPYVLVEDATYHFGFHAIVAAFVWLTDFRHEQAVLIIGQVLNAAMALQIYLFSYWLTRRRWAAFFGAFFVALISTMPAYYVSWGRYTQLTGLLILPVVAVLTIDGVERREWRILGLALFCQAGLILIHYRVLAFNVCLVVAWWLSRLLEKPSEWRWRGREVGLYLGLGFGSALMLMPWLIIPAVDLWLQAFQQWGGTGRARSVLWDFSLAYVGAGFDRYLLTVGGLGALVSLWTRRRMTIVLLVWLALLFVVTNPSLVGLPGEGLTNNIAMLITWFIPQAIWSGFMIDTVLRDWWNTLKWQGRSLLCGVTTLAFLTLGVFGFRQQVSILSPETLIGLGTEWDAFEWIEAHTPYDSRFLINTRPWQGIVDMGTDGGYWITPLTGRQSTTPPALYPLGDEKYVQGIREFNKAILASKDSPETLALRIRDANVDYVYVGALGGPFSPLVLDAVPGLTLAYVDTYTRIYQVE